MGYYTEYDLEVINGDNTVDYKAEVGKASKYNATDIFEEEIKWYDYEEDMIAFSKKCPTVIFKLMGEGEESGDSWIQYFKNGKSQRCDAIITFPDFDESKLT